MKGQYKPIQKVLTGRCNTPYSKIAAILDSFAYLQINSLPCS